MARRYLADRNSGSAATNEIAELRAEIDRLKAAQSLPAKEPTVAEVEEALRKADDE
ncbi:MULTISPECIES: hypothetical protein [unclassified Brucella]|uniref:hypothetical protein n=1 Tax=unclassified Brucella TaxID=2632610 RepID=UPI0012AD2AB0|nr:MULTISPECIES: hypothetical protein [unclassified Brucella]MRN77657.1 hypothetical protein [Brucella sp. 10RB9210]